MGQLRLRGEGKNKKSFSQKKKLFKLLDLASLFYSMQGNAIKKASELTVKDSIS